MKTTIVLIRHGETIWNKERRIQGQTDVPLSEEGIKEAKALVKTIKKFEINHVYTSGLKRAINTAEIAFKNTEISFKKHEGFNERNYGIYEGKTWEEVEKEHKGIHSFFLSDIEKGESRLIFEKRVVKAFEEINKKHKGKTVLIVCHGGVINVLFRYFRGISKDEVISYRFPNASVSVVEIEKDKVVEKMIGDISHL